MNMKMRKLGKSLCVLVAAVVIAALPLASEAEVVKENFQVRGSFADAYAASYEECKSTYAYIGGGDQVSHSTGNAPIESGYAYAWVSYSNWCTGEAFSGWGWTDVSPTINGLNNATLSVPVNLYTYSCTWDPETGWWSCNYTDLG